MLLFLNVSIFLISLLAVFKAPAKPLWFVAIGATEWGHVLAIGSLILLFWNWRKARRFNGPSLLMLMATALFLSPLVRAVVAAQSLPEELAHSFGHVLPHESLEAPARPRPLVMPDLFRGVHSPGIRMTTKVYATVNGKPLAMDIYDRVEREVSGHPAVVVVHGGSWQSGDREEFPDLNRYLAARGYVVASIDYRLAPAAIFPAQVNDLFSAITYLKKHAAEVGWDAKGLVVLGRSAGGEIALSAAYAQQEPVIKGVIALYTPNDLLWGYRNPTNPLIMNSKKVIRTYLGGTPEQIPKNYEASSPLSFVTPKTPPTLMIHGMRDELVSPIHEERLSRKLKEKGRSFFWLRLPWGTHGCDANFSGPCGQLSTYAIERFLAALLIQ